MSGGNLITEHILIVILLGYRTYFSVYFNGTVVQKYYLVIKLASMVLNLKVY